jgi:DNA (cytosine-5)-methyltransferase 1
VGPSSLNVLSVCAGGGGLDLAVKLALPGTRTVCYVEREAFAAHVLATGMSQGLLDDAPLWSDLRTFDGDPWRGVVDWLIGGYPCQPFSTAGKRRGVDDPRHLWPWIHRLVSILRPSGCFFENVSGHLSLGFDTVAGELSDLGYRVTAGLFTASQVGATHKRARLYILALADHEEVRCKGSGCGERREPHGAASYWRRPFDDDGAVANDLGAGRERDQPGELSGERRRAKRRTAAQLRRAFVADADSQQLRQAAADPSDRAGGTAPEGAGPHVADSDRGRREQRHAQERLISEPVEGRESLADANGGERPGPGRVEPGWRAHVADGLPLFPPLPRDYASWLDVLERDPDLAPATERPFRCVADGLASDRARWIRLLGNGVVPLQGAYALRTLLAVQAVSR